MKVWMLAAGVVLAIGTAGAAMAQGDVIAERRAGLRGLGQGMQAFNQAIQQRGDTRALAPRVDEMIAFVRTLPTRVPTASLTPPVAQGTQDGQTRALAVIDTGRADFAMRATNMVALLEGLKTAALAGTVTADTMRVTSDGCTACHNTYRAR